VRLKLLPRRLPRLLGAVSLGLLLVLASGPTVAAAGLPSRAGMLTGIDVSHWQSAINWPQVKAAGVKFAFAKATEGTKVVDGRYAGNRDRAEAAGVSIGAYHFGRPDRTTNDAVREANWFVDHAGLRGRHLLPVLDLESTGGLGRWKLTNWVRNWLKQVESRLGVKPVIYTYPFFWLDYMGNTTWFAANGYRVLWIAHYDVKSPRVPASNWNGHGWTLWQLSDCGRIAGIDGCVDVDLYDGTDLSRMLIRNNR
jgi:GH25 family lysozyme M1 (1,4-beta-N-acetylmuramidase)